MRMSPEDNESLNNGNAGAAAAAAAARSTPGKKRRPSWSDLWSNKEAQALKNAVLKLRLQSASNSTTPPSEPEPENQTLNLGEDLNPSPNKSPSSQALPDYTSHLSDELLLNVLSKLPQSQHVSNSLVCKRWCQLSGRLVCSIKLFDWEFLESGRLTYRFPNLIDIDIVRGCLRSGRNSGIVLSNRVVSLHLESSFSGAGFVRKEGFWESEVIDRGVRILADGCSNLRKVVLIHVSEEGLNSLAERCETLQELELHCCNDMVLKGISGCRNLQILRLIGFVAGLYESVVSDIGLTILAQRCPRLVKLELTGCEGSYDGIKAIGQCCQMLEELTLCDHRMEGGWLSALSYCENLKTLKLQSCSIIDSDPGPDQHLGSCKTLEDLYLQRCQLHDKQGIRALFLMCETVRELIIEDCWGMDSNIFAAASICRNVRFLSLEGCSLLTTEALESVLLSWKDLQRLRVVSCKNIRDTDMTPALATLFSILKELKWRPDSRALLASGLAGTEIGQKGGRYFKWK